MRHWIGRVVVVLISINAALGVAAVIFGGEVEGLGRVLASSLLATTGAIVAMTCAPAWAKRRLGWVPRIGVVASVVGFGTLIALVWTSFEPESLVKAAATAVIAAVAAALASLLSGWQVRGPARWLHPVTYALVAAFAGLLITGMWAEIDANWFWRVVAALAVLLAGGSVAIPVLSRTGDPEAGYEIRVTACPICGSPLDSHTGTEVTCPECGVTFAVVLAEGA